MGSPGYTGTQQWYLRVSKGDVSPYSLGTEWSLEVFTMDSLLSPEGETKMLELGERLVFFQMQQENKNLEPQVPSSGKCIEDFRISF